MELLTALGLILALLIFSSYFMGFGASEIFPRSRDSRRVGDLKLLENLIGRYLADGNSDMDGPNRRGTCVDEESPTVYVSIPSDSGWKLPDLPDGWRWEQVPETELKRTNGLGWLPLNLEKYTVRFRADLAVDPVNIADDFEGRNKFFYVYVCHNQAKKFQLAAKLESLYYGVDYFGSGGKNDIAFKDGGKFAGLYERGTDFNLLPDDGVFCPAGMIWVGANRLNSGFCIDAYEASWSEGNKPVSAAGKNPWSSLPDGIFPYFGQAEAVNYCQSVGKRLPEDYEWFLAGRGTPDELEAPVIGEEACHQWNDRSDLPHRIRKPKEAVWQDTAYEWSTFSKGFVKTGTARRCRSAYGAFDMAGNLFEFTANMTQSGKRYGKISLPSRNYVAEINQEGIPVKTSSGPAAAFNHDYFWLDNEDEHVFLRGGSWFDKEKSGVLSLNLILRQGAGDYNVGFRCAR